MFAQHRATSLAPSQVKANTGCVLLRHKQANIEVVCPPTGTLQSVGTVADVLDKGSGALILLDGESDQVLYHIAISFVYLFIFHRPFNVSLS